MNMSRADIQKLLKYEFQLGQPASEAAQNINRAQRAKTMEKSTARRWFSKFRYNDLNLEDKPQPGQPRKINWRTVVNATELDPTMKTQILADDFECSHTGIEKILHKGLINKFFKSRQKIAKRPLGPLRAYRNPETEARRYGDCFAETSTPIAVFGTNRHSRREWVPFVNHCRRNQWLSPNQRRCSTPRADFRQKKAMLSVRWNRRGPIHWELLETG